MTKKDFFRILIKLFALNSLLLSVFTYLPQNFRYVGFGNDNSIFILISGIVLLIVALFIVIVWKTDSIIHFLKLDRGFDDDRIDFKNFNPKNLIKFALIFIGGFLVIDYLPMFLQNTYLGFKIEVSSTPIQESDLLGTMREFNKFDWISSGLNLLLGFILLTNYSKISSWLDDKK